MNPNDTTPPRGRSRALPVALALAVATCITLLLIAASGGVLFYVLAGVAAIVGLGLLHYLVWGHAMREAPLGAPRGAPLNRPDAWENARQRQDRH